MALNDGDRVQQPNYGFGDVIDCSGRYVTIAFDDGITRKFVASIVDLTPTSVPRPPRPEPAARSRKKARQKA
jgi:hypothetical protein